MTNGVGLPVAAAVKVACCPSVNVRFEGCCVMTGSYGPMGFTVRMATDVVVLPAELVNRARNR